MPSTTVSGAARHEPGALASAPIALGPVDRTGSRVWLSWVAYSMAGVALAAVLTVLSRAPGVNRGLVPLLAIAGLVVIGTAQWIVLRRYRRSMRWWPWVLATIVGQAAATVVGFAALLMPGLLGALRAVAAPAGAGAVAFVTAGVIGALTGAVAGLPAAVVLRRHFTGVLAWVMATAVAGAAGAILPVVSAIYSLGGSTGPIVVRIVTGLIAACLTGIAVVRLVGGELPVGRTERTESARSVV